MMRLALILSLLAGGVAADTAPYLDDRSDPEALIRSLYSAIDRHEYARAWSYWDTAPADSFAAYADGYEGTDIVEIRVGRVTEEGAAGSTYGMVPVVLVARGADGRTGYYAGCYITRLGNPAAQEPPFGPMRIVAGQLRPGTDMPVACAPDGTPSF